MIILLLNFLFFELPRIFCPNHFFIFLSMIFFSKIMKKFQPQKMSFKQDFLLLRFLRSSSMAAEIQNLNSFDFMIRNAVEYFFLHC